MKKRMVALTAAIILMFVNCFSVSAASGDSFSRVQNIDDTTTAVPTQAVYTPTEIITATSLGLSDSFGGLYDVFCADDGKTYLLCSDDSRIVILNNDRSLHSELFLTDSNGEEIRFKGAKGIYVDTSGNIYVADTDSSRVLYADESGSLIKEYVLPSSPLIPEDFTYQPISVVKDNEGYLYILSLGGYYGAITYSPDDEFIGFFGSNTVSATVLDTLSLIWEQLTQNDEKKSASVKKLPYSFVDLAVNSDGFIYTCTGATEERNGTGQIRRISPVGSNILLYQAANGDYGSSDSFAFLEEKVVSRFSKPRTQNIVSIDVTDTGYIFALDKTYGLVYMYDNECNLISGFGGGLGEGDKLGLFVSPEAISVNEDSVWIADSETMSVTVFDVTEYGKILKSAQSLYLDGDYEEADHLWDAVLKYDNSNQMAFCGKAMVSFNAGDYEKALEYSKKGMDLAVYNLAYQVILMNFFSENFVWILIVVIIILSLIIFSVVYLKKHDKTLIKNDKIKTALLVSIHPFSCFEDIKQKKKGSVKIAFVILCVFFLATILKDTASGFLFTKVSDKNYNVLITVVQTFGIIILWSVVNWLVSSLLSGKGNLKEVFVATAYSLVPLIIYTVIYVIASHFMALSGLEFFNVLYIAVLIYTFYLLSVGIMTVHDCNFFKFLLMCFVTLFGMILVVFLFFMIIILLQQFGNFVYSIFMEIFYR